MRKVIIVAALLAVLIGSDGARAAAAEDFLDMLNDNSPVTTTNAVIIELALIRIYSGIQSSNVFIKTRGGKPFFCPPGKFKITKEQAAEFFKRFLNKNPELKRGPASSVMLLAMMDVFPCKK